jgi:hypothetical protein
VRGENLKSAAGKQGLIPGEIPGELKRRAQPQGHRRNMAKGVRLDLAIRGFDWGEYGLACGKRLEEIFRSDMHE